MIRDVIRYQKPSTFGLLCIDIWDCNGKNDSFYRLACEKLKKYNISAVVNCTMDLCLDYSDPSVFNTLSQYHWNKESHLPQQLADNVLIDLIKSAGSQKSSRIIKENFFNKETIHLSRKETFIYHTQKHWPFIQDWIILGSAWKLCLHIGPLGIDKLVGIPSHKFYIFPEWSIQNENKTIVFEQQIHDDFLVWAPVDDGGYRLITVASNHKWLDNKDYVDSING